MTDDELEQRLWRQSVAAPDPSLRARVLDAATGEPRHVRLATVDYMMLAIAAALVLVASVIDVPALPTSIDAARQREIADVTAALGGGPDAAQYAELVVSREDEPADPLSMEGTW